MSAPNRDGLLARIKRFFGRDERRPETPEEAERRRVQQRRAHERQRFRGEAHVLRNPDRR
ncbi:hypothetical protein [Propioniciclava sp.]|uniref:hypothetical protein n=1 Tax=Propioniciclava sp. TaxID=2038686 RepID=UPI00262FFA5C|nr:hypothetical protein [Propioniciclava sp.]